MMRSGTQQQQLSPEARFEQIAKISKMKPAITTIGASVMRRNEKMESSNSVAVWLPPPAIRMKPTTMMATPMSISK